MANIEQINFRMSAKLKKKLDQRAARDKIPTSRVLRMAALWYSEGGFTDSQLEEAIKLDLAEFPENRGRPKKKSVEKRRRAKVRH